MFDRVNILFLSALAFTAWCVICYFSSLEDQRIHDFKVELYTEHPGLTKKQIYSEKPEAGVPRSFFTFVIMACLGICLCLTCALVKLLRFLEARARQIKEQEVHREEEVYASLLSEQLREKINNLRHRRKLINELVNKQQFSGGLGLQARDGMQLPTSGSGCSEAQTNGIPLELHSDSDSGCSDQQASCSGCLELQPISSSCTNRGYNDNADSLNELWIRGKDVCSASSSVSHRMPVVPKAFTSPSNHSIYITNSQIHIHAKMINSEPTDMELVRESRLYARQPSVFLQVSDNFITGPRDRIMTSGSSCNVGLPPPYITKLDRPN